MTNQSSDFRSMFVARNQRPDSCKRNNFVCSRPLLKASDMRFTGHTTSAAWKIKLHSNSLLILEVILIDANFVVFPSVRG